MNNERKRRILIADEQTHIRSALRLLLEQEPDFVVVGEAADAQGLLHTLAQQTADILLLDWQLPGLTIHHLLVLLRMEWPAVQLVIMSTRPEDRHQAARVAVPAFLSKSASPEIVLATLRQSFPHPGRPEDLVKIS